MDAIDENGFQEGSSPKPRQLPDDLPKSLDDRKNVPVIGGETEIYDAWQGQSAFLSNPVSSKPLSFNLSLDEPGFGSDPSSTALQDSDEKLVQMLERQAQLKHDSMNTGNEDAIVKDEKLSEAGKREILQSSLNLAASNGDVDAIERLVSGSAKDYIDINAPDSEGTPPLIYASCFGHEQVVEALLDAGANVDTQDRNRWTPLMWAMTNRHKAIAKLLLDKGAKPELETSTGRTAFDFVAPGSDLSEYLNESGYTIGNAGVQDDFYSAGFGQDKFEEEMAETEFRRRMMMESALNLEIDLGNLGLDEQPEEPEEDFGDEHEFRWDICLNDQMFVFQENELDRILDIIITNMTPVRSPSQKPVPANILFLSARYAHYHASPELLEKLLVSAMDKINDVVEKHQWDMTILAFWISNATLLLHYLKKDTGLVEATTEFQAELAELINEIFILIIRDAERRMDKVLDTAMLDHETIPGFEDVTFQHEWKIFKTKSKPKPEPMEKRFRPPSPKRRAQVSPRNITSLLSSTLFVLDLYDIHSVITAQVLSQLLYWLGAELFNRIMSNRKYLARTKAMQIRMNVSTLEDWARSNNRQPEHYENGAMTATGENTFDAARRHMGPVVQLLQWLQCFSSLGEDLDSLKATLEQLPRLTPQQLNHTVKYYRPEVGEKNLPKPALKYLMDREKEVAERRLSKQSRKSLPPLPLHGQASDSAPSTPAQEHPPTSPTFATPATVPPNLYRIEEDDEEEEPEGLLLDPSIMLPFSLPTSTDMLVTYGAGFGGTNRERERKYLPTVPPEFLAKLDISGGSKGIRDLYDNARWSDDGN